MPNLALILVSEDKCGVTACTVLGKPTLAKRRTPTAATQACQIEHDAKKRGSKANYIYWAT